MMIFLTYTQHHQVKEMLNAAVDAELGRVYSDHKIIFLIYIPHLSYILTNTRCYQVKEMLNAAVDVELGRVYYEDFAELLAAE